MDRRQKIPCVYIIGSQPDGILYIGVTSDLYKRMSQHTQELYEGFSKRLGVKDLLYSEIHETMDAAILREKCLKEWQRAWKVRLIRGFNPEWRNLYDDATGEIADGPADIAREHN